MLADSWLCAHFRRNPKPTSRRGMGHVLCFLGRECLTLPSRRWQLLFLGLGERFLQGPQCLHARTVTQLQSPRLGVSTKRSVRCRTLPLRRPLRNVAL